MFVFDSDTGQDRVVDDGEDHLPGPMTHCRATLALQPNEIHKVFLKTARKGGLGVAVILLVAVIS